MKIPRRIGNKINTPVKITKTNKQLDETTLISYIKIPHFTEIKKKPF